jgi:hypothetical protein
VISSRPVNYRCGFQRLYAVLAIAWVAALLFVLPSGRVSFWVADHPVASSAITKRIASNGKTYVFPLDATKDEIQELVGLSVAWAEVPNGDWQHETKSDNRPEPLSPRPGQALWLAGVLFVPPMLGYATIFLLIPWIYRGFRPPV